MSLRLNTLVVAIAAVVAASAAHSADEPVGDAVSEATGQAADATTSQLDAIMVTAQRRRQNLLEVPLSLSALTREQLQSTGVRSVTDLRLTTPGLLTGTGSGYVQTFIRGIGNRIQVGADSSVVTFIDDVPRGYPSLVDDLGNVDRIEILKGAQGGLYGRNATAGVMNIVTRQPDPSQVTGDVRVGLGSEGAMGASAYVNIPLTQSAAIDFTAAKRVHDSHVDNQAIASPYSRYLGLSPQELAQVGDTGQHSYLSANPGLVSTLDSRVHVSELSNKDETFFETKALFQGDGFSVRLAADVTKKDDASGNAWKSLQLPRSYGTYVALMGGAGHRAGALPYAYLYPAEGYGDFEAASPIDSYSRLNDYGISAKADVDFDAFTLTSISAYRGNKTDFRTDVTGSAVPAAGFHAKFDRRNFYQELRAVSSAEGPFRWQGGATYYNEDVDNSTATLLLGETFTPVTAKTGGDGYSIYFQGEYDFSNELSLMASARYVDEVKTARFPAGTAAIYDPDTGIITQGVRVSEFSAESPSAKLLPSVTLSYRLPGSGTVYGRWARGMKSGGANPMVHPAQTLGRLNPLNPEHVDTYEIGLRTALFDRRLQFTSALFYNDYRDLQVVKSGYPGLAAYNINAGKTRTYGGEFSVNWRASEIFTLSTGLGYLNAKYSDFSSEGVPELRVAPFDVSGNWMVNAPEWQGFAAASFNVPMNDRYNFVSTLLYSYSSSYYTDDTNEVTTMQDAFSVVNLRIGAESADGRIGLYVSANNLFNKEYVVWGSVAPAAYNVQLGSPRILMANLEYRF